MISLPLPNASEKPQSSQTMLTTPIDTKLYMIMLTTFLPRTSPP